MAIKCEEMKKGCVLRMKHAEYAKNSKLKQWKLLVHIQPVHPFFMKLTFKNNDNILQMLQCVISH